MSDGGMESIMKWKKKCEIKIVAMKDHAQREKEDMVLNKGSIGSAVRMEPGHDIKEGDVSNAIRRNTTKKERDSCEPELTERVNTRIASNYSPEQ